MNKQQKKLDKAIAGMKNPVIRAEFQKAIAENRKARGKG